MFYECDPYVEISLRFILYISMLHFYHVLKSELHGVNDMFSVLPYNISFKHGYNVLGVTACTI